MTEYAQIADARLRKLGEAEWEIKSCMQRIEELENVAQCCGSLNITDKVQNSISGNRMEDAVIKILKEKENLSKIVNEWISLKEEIMKELQILSPVCREIIIEKYVNNEKTDKIAKKVNYSYSHTRLLRDKSLEKLGKLIEKNLT
mgnify:FL=1